MKNVRKYAANTFWLFTERAVQLGLGFTIGIWLVRYLGPASYGAYSYALSVVGLCAPIASLGLDAILVRELIRHPRQLGWWLGSAFYLRLLAAASLIAMLALGLPGSSITTELKGMILVLSFSLAAPAVGVIDSYFQKQVASVYTVQAKVIALLCSSAAKVLLILMQAPVFYFALILTAESVILCLVLLFNYRRLGESVRAWRWYGPVARKLLAAGWPLWLTGIAIAAYLKVDQIMIQHWLGLDAVGQYGAAVRVSEALFFIPAALTSTFYPAILAAKEQGETPYLKRLQFFYDLMIWGGFVISVTLWLAGPCLMRWFYGDTYLAASQVIRWHTPSLWFVFMSQAASRWFLAEGRQRALLVLHAGGAVANIVLNLLLIPQYGLQGAALATVLSYGVAAYGGHLLWPAVRPNLRLLNRSLYLPGAVKRLSKFNLER